MSWPRVLLGLALTQATAAGMSPVKLAAVSFLSCTQCVLVLEQGGFHTHFSLRGMVDLINDYKR